MILALIIIDGEMQNIITSIEAIRRVSEVRLIFMSSPVGNQMDTARVLSLIISDYLFKPIAKTDLVSAIEALSNQSEEFTDLDSSKSIPGTFHCSNN